MDKEYQQEVCKEYIIFIRTRRDCGIEEGSILGKGIGKLYGKCLMSKNTKQLTSGRNSEMRKESDSSPGKTDRRKD